MSDKKKNTHHKAIQSPHDSFVKEILSRKENARDFFSHYLPEHILALVDLDSLEIAKDSFIEKEFKEYFSDLLYQLRLSGIQQGTQPQGTQHEESTQPQGTQPQGAQHQGSTQPRGAQHQGSTQHQGTQPQSTQPQGAEHQGAQPGYLYLLFEHKSSPERWVAFHLLRYQVKIWELFLKQNKKARRLPVIVPLVLYHGTRHWRVGTRLSDLIEGPREDLKAYIPDFSYLLCDLSPYGNAQIKGAAILRVFLMLLKYIHHPELVTYLRQILPLLKELAHPNQELVTYLEIIIRYIFNATDRVNVDELKEIVETSLAKDEEGIIMTLAEQLIQKGKEEGLQQGMQRGMQQGIQQGLQEGKLEKSREAIVEVLEARFGPLPASVRGRLSAIVDVVTLEGLLKKAATAPSLAEWEKGLPMSTLS
jgi:predicted transposase/invertase (TIGR01784 family)